MRKSGARLGAVRMVGAMETTQIYAADASIQLLHGDALAVLRGLPSGSVRCIVTSPPYWGLRDYGASGQIGLEASPDAYVAALVQILREARRVLADDGTLWLNMGDSFAAYRDGKQPPQTISGGKRRGEPAVAGMGSNRNRKCLEPYGLKHKDLIGMPWRVALALQADGWWLRSEVIWEKTSPLPSRVIDRLTVSHEQLFLLSKSERYYFDVEAIKEPTADNTGLRRRRTVWRVANRKEYPAAHFATYPTALIEPCIHASTQPGDTVLDPFIGSGTTALVAREHGRHAIGIDLNTAYLDIASQRLGLNKRTPS